MYHSVCPSSELGLPQPLSRQRVFSSPQNRVHSPTGEVLGCPNSGDRRKSSALCLFCASHSLAGGLYRILSSYSLAHYYFMKKSAEVLHYFSWIVGCWNSSNILLTSCPPNIKCIVPAFFEDRFGGKDCCLCTYNPPAEEVG